MQGVGQAPIAVRQRKQALFIPSPAISARNMGMNPSRSPTVGIRPLALAASAHHPESGSLPSSSSAVAPSSEVASADLSRAGVGRCGEAQRTRWISSRLGRVENAAGAADHRGDPGIRDSACLTDRA